MPGSRRMKIDEFILQWFLQYICDKLGQFQIRDLSFAAEIVDFPDLTLTNQKKNTCSDVPSMNVEPRSRSCTTWITMNLHELTVENFLNHHRNEFLTVLPFSKCIHHVNPNNRYRISIVVRHKDVFCRRL